MLSLIAFVVSAAAAGVCFKLFQRFDDNVAVQLITTVVFAITSQAALSFIPDTISGWPTLTKFVLILKLVAIFVAAIVAAIMFTITGNWIFTALGIVALAIFLVMFFASLPGEAQAVLTDIFNRGSGRWKGFGEQLR